MSREGSGRTKGKDHWVIKSWPKFTPFVSRLYPFTNHLLTSWDIKVESAFFYKRTFDNLHSPLLLRLLCARNTLLQLGWSVWVAGLITIVGTKFLAAFKRKGVWLAGNHGSLENGAVLESLSYDWRDIFFSSMKNFSIASMCGRYTYIDHKNQLL